LGEYLNYLLVSYFINISNCA